MAELNKDHAEGHTYTRRPVQVEAIQWQGWNTTAVAEFLRYAPQVTKHADGSTDLQAPGITRVSESDWIVRDHANVLAVWTDYYFNYLYQGPA